MNDEQVSMHEDAQYLLAIIEQLAGLDPGTLSIDNSRKVHMVYCRRIFCVLLKKRYARMTLAAVGAYLGDGKDHATVLHAQKMHEREYGTNREYEQLHDLVWRQFDEQGIHQFNNNKKRLIVVLSDMYTKRLQLERDIFVLEHRIGNRDLGTRHELQEMITKLEHGTITS